MTLHSSSDRTSERKDGSYTGEQIIPVMIAILMIVCIAIKYGVSMDPPVRFASCTLRYSLLILLLIRASTLDIRQRLLPNRLAAAVSVLSLLRLIGGTSLPALVTGCIPVIIIFPVILAAEAVKRRKMVGRGDIKLLFALGLHYGVWEMLYIILTACIIAIISFLVFFRPQKRGIPLGPAITAGAFIVTLLK